MNQIWFKQLGVFYIPIHAWGYLITLLAIIFLLPVCLAVMCNGHSINDGLYHIFVYTTCTAFWWKWIAEKTSK